MSGFVGLFLKVKLEHGARVILGHDFVFRPSELVTGTQWRATACVEKSGASLGTVSGFSTAGLTSAFDV